MEIVSIFAVTDYKTGKSYREFKEGFGQDIVKSLRGEYPRFSKIVLEGFEIDSAFKPLDLRTYNYIR